MLSTEEKNIRDAIEAKLSGTIKDEAFLFHISVERKLKSVEIWFQNVETILPDFIQATGTARSGQAVTEGLTPDLESLISKISAYIDAFFMSGKSVLDTFAHELRILYGLGGHTGDLYFGESLSLLNTHHLDTQINSYLSGIDFDTLNWHKDLNAYRHASTHESIIPIKPSMDFDFITGEWKEMILKLPLDTAQRPLTYNGKNFNDVGKEIQDNLFNLIVECYRRIWDDIGQQQTIIPFNTP